mgnify:CR=1 FL=1
MMVKTDGIVIPAHGRCYDFPVGNLTDTPLEELWNNARFLEFRKLLKHAGGTLPARVLLWSHWKSAFERKARTAPFLGFAQE